MHLVLNVGSSSLKASVFRETSDGNLWLAGKLEVGGIGTQQIAARATLGDAAHDLGVDFAAVEDHRSALHLVLRALAQIGVPVADVRTVGHRVVHGGVVFSEPTIVDTSNRKKFDGLAKLAPSHMPPCLEIIDAARTTFADALHVVCFDTAFHADMPEVARRLPLPDAYDALGYRRYGFHGLSYESAMGALKGGLGRVPERVIVLHLGNGASAAALLAGRSIATTMGYSTVDGLVMGTRTGSLDAGVLLGLMRDQAMSPAQIERLIYQESGLLALSGETSDMRMLLASTSKRAAFAVDYYTCWAARHVGSLAVALGGLDALVFTGGIGENAAAIRAGICARLEFLGARIDLERNAEHHFEITHAAASVRIFVVRANEELVIARHAQQALFAFIASGTRSV